MNNMQFISFEDYLFEFNKTDVFNIYSKSDYFTIAFEWELETDDENVLPLETDYEKIKNKFFSRVEKKKVPLKGYEEFIERIINSIDLKDDEKTFNYILNSNKYSDEYEAIIIDIIYDVYEEYLDEKDERKNDVEDTNQLNYLTNKVKENLPNFYKKWNKELKFVFDYTLDKGIEFSPQLYFIGLEQAIESLNDFFNDYNKQNYWKFTEKTGFHINIGIIDNKQFNTLKGFLFLQDYLEDPNKIPFVFKKMEWRLHNKFVGSLKSKIYELIDKQSILLKDIPVNLNVSNLKNLELSWHNLFLDIIKRFGFKLFGFNLIHIENENYIEFRQVGGIITKELITEKLNYFCYLILLMTDENYKRKEYINKLYKFLDNIKSKL